MKTAVLGYGLIGKERVQALQAMRAKGFETDILVHDPQIPRGPETGAPDGVRFVPTHQALMEEGPDWCIVATPHHISPDLARHALAAGAKVLIEKPLGITLADSESLLQAGGKRLWVGYNYRFFAGVAALWNDFQTSRFGHPICIRMSLGHGGSPDLLGTWKLAAKQVGGGCLLDPGTHLLDLSLTFASAGLRAAGGQAWRGFWDRGIDEDAQILLDAGGFPISLDISIVRWRSTFTLECHGSDGYGRVSGRGRSYGPQTYVRGPRWGWQQAANQAASEEHVLTTDCTDSFQRELEALMMDIPAPGAQPCTAVEAAEGMRLYDQCVKLVEIGK